MLLRIGAAKKEAGRAFGFVTIRLPMANEKVSRETFRFRVEKEKLQKAGGAAQILLQPHQKEAQAAKE